MNRYTVTFADGTIVNVIADDCEIAQEKAIDYLESEGVVHCEIVSIRRG